MMKMISGSNAIWRALPLLESPPLSSQVLSMSSKLGDGGDDDGHDDDDDDDDDGDDGDDYDDEAKYYFFSL